MRLGADALEDDANEEWPLERIADAYEIVASIEEDGEYRRAAAFVAGTAQQILSRRTLSQSQVDSSPLISRERVDPSLSAALLFLIAEQYADANEAALAIPKSGGYREAIVLGDHIRDLSRGKLVSILHRADRWREGRRSVGRLDNRAFRALAAALCDGIEILAAHMLSMPLPDSTPQRFATAQSAFRSVIGLASNTSERASRHIDGHYTTHFAGPAHLASLLLSVADALNDAALTKLVPPTGAEATWWSEWLRFRATSMPFLWRNHREAIAKEFYETGKSAVLVLPTGAGKTTVSALKIAGVIARGKKVIFLAPTHALVEQLTEDLQEIFPEDKFELGISSDFDSVLLDDQQLQSIEVMTPERCLAMLSFSPSSFSQVGLLVFDECHLLSPDTQKIGRALDGMLCILAFLVAAPEADLLFLSAMLNNGEQFANWISELTGRSCVAVELLWKPSRQARGIVVYDEREVQKSLSRARSQQRKQDLLAGKTAKSLRVAAEREITARPYVVWGLHHNWMAVADAYSHTAIINEPLTLGGGFKNGSLWASPNANEVAARIASNAVLGGLKTIVFVNTKADSVRVARKIATQIEFTVNLSEGEEALWEVLVAELGDEKHSIFAGRDFSAVPHNSAMLRLERAMSERLFRRSDGAKVIVATPTLAQGLNLPASLAVLAGDKRAGEAKGERRPLEAHELLNAAARAGRAGHLANGLVILIPEPLIRFLPGETLRKDLKDKLNSVLPNDDRCVAISDPLEIVLDRIMEGDFQDRDVRYTINRLASLSSSPDFDVSKDNILIKSFGAFLARANATENEYNAKMTKLWTQARLVADESTEAAVLLIASQSGLPLDLLERLRMRLQTSLGRLPTSVVAWLEWTIDWLKEDADARQQLLSDVSRSALIATGRAGNTELDAEILSNLLPGIIGWVQGETIRQIEEALGGSPDGSTDLERLCPRARELVSTFIPRGLAYATGIISRMGEEIKVADVQEDLDEGMMRGLSAAVRRGFVSLSMLEYANENKMLIGRVQLHRSYLSQFFLPE
ncbi:hypothetical protein GCM10007276_14760 [Agaricicola taiwanensis]|uniref:DEAD/DEAH box helicase n=2 Tax=Agaricicola taiwanensis TaxID=591372 RepID=A0A8J2VS18_9RHOB|nr:hypothetical protein GCM10007276_14760 [Agaricicola taiwanensis]